MENGRLKVSKIVAMRIEQRRNIAGNLKTMMIREKAGNTMQFLQQNR